MVVFEVSESSTGTGEDAWLAAISRRDLAAVRIEPTWREALVVSAHPDDDVLAVGDLLRGLQSAGMALRSIVVTDGERSAPASVFGSAETLGRLRRAELRRAYLDLGIDPAVGWLGLPDGAVAGHEAEVARHLSERVGPDTLLLAPWRRDGHPDHDAAGRAAFAAATATGAVLWEFPVWAWHWAEPEGGSFPWWRARAWVCGDIVAKERAIDRFETQVRPVEKSDTGGAVLPASVLRRFHRPFEVVFT